MPADCAADKCAPGGSGHNEAFWRSVAMGLILYVFLISRDVLPGPRESIHRRPHDSEGIRADERAAWLCVQRADLGLCFVPGAGRQLADLFGPRRVLTFGILWWSFFTALTALVPPDIASAMFLLILVRFLWDPAEAVMFPASTGWWPVGFPPGNGESPTASSSGAWAPAPPLAPPLITWIIAKLGMAVVILPSGFPSAL